MKEELLKDRSGKVIGKIKQQGKLLVIFNQSGTRLGEYDPRLNHTKDRSGKLIGKGNLLMLLLK